VLHPLDEILNLFKAGTQRLTDYLDMAGAAMGEANSLVHAVLKAANRDPGRVVNGDLGVERTLEGTCRSPAIRRFQSVCHDAVDNDFDAVERQRTDCRTCYMISLLRLFLLEYVAGVLTINLGEQHGAGGDEARRAVAPLDQPRSNPLLASAPGSMAGFR